MTAKPGDLQVVNAAALERRWQKLCLVCAAVGFAGGAVFMHSISTAEASRAVKATLLQVGQHLCKDWSGLENIERVSEDAYTFTCKKYAAFRNLEVTFQTCSTDTECMLAHGGDGGPEERP